MSQITIRPLYELAEMYDAVELQKTYWGEEIESVVPAHMLFTIALYGGQVLAAMDGDKMIGVLIGLLGADMTQDERPAMANLMIASKRMVVLPEYRSQGIGYQLKLAQREFAIKQGIRLVTWTFDPLLSRNGYLNLRKLGSISQKYVENLFGTGGELSSLGSSDRFSVEWWVWTPRVEARVNGEDGKPSLDAEIERGAMIVNPTAQKNGYIYPSDHDINVDETHLLVEIPPNYPDIETADPGLALGWRDHSRGIFQNLMGRGYLVTDFIHQTDGERERSFYLMLHRSRFDFNTGEIFDETDHNQDY